MKHRIACQHFGSYTGDPDLNPHTEVIAEGDARYVRLVIETSRKADPFCSCGGAPITGIEALDPVPQGMRRWRVPVVTTRTESVDVVAPNMEAALVLAYDGRPRDLVNEEADTDNDDVEIEVNVNGEAEWQSLGDVCDCPRIQGYHDSEACDDDDEEE